MASPRVSPAHAIAVTSEVSDEARSLRGNAAADGLYKSAIVEVIVSVALLTVARCVTQHVRRLDALLPVAVVVAPTVSAGGLAAATHSGSALLIALAAAMLVTAVAGLAAWLLVAERRAKRPPRHVPWSDADWQSFERSFWAQVSRRSDRPPPRRTADELDI